MSSPDIDGKRLVRLLALGLIIGIPAAAGAAAFTSVEHWLQHLLWTDLPDSFGWEQPAAWWIVLVLIVGALLVMAAARLPGHGGHNPMDGLAFDIGPRQIASVVLVAWASLAFGAVLGPEAPLMAIGTAIAVLFARRAEADARQVLMFAGAMAAMSLILGNPLIVSILLLEAVALGGSKGQAIVKVLPALAALASGYLVQLGFAGLPGVGSSALAVPGLPTYDQVQWQDLLISVPLAVVVAAVVVVALRGAEILRPIVTRRPDLMLLAIAAVVGILTVLATWLDPDISYDLILFSGQAAIPTILTFSAVGTLALVAVVKTIAFALCLPSGFRGGILFPAVYIGVVLGTLAASLLDFVSLTAMVATGIAAAAAAIFRLPFTAVLLSVMLCASAGLASTSLAIIAAIIGLLFRVGMDASSGLLGPRVMAKAEEPAA
ncbi:MAG: chloride channel protein [Actinobacteria bacterium]|nr:chloride channel protein [Actinomycetota bacterium]